MKRHWKTYLSGFITLLVLEMCIALFVNDTVIRPFAGDMLVVLMLYCFAMTLLLRTGKKTKTPIIAIGVLIFAFCVEGLQAIDTLEWLGLSDHRWAAIVLGSTFDWWDLLAYSAGTLLILIIEKTV
ncbi:MAG: hypothetical protein ACI828_000766 [Flavobacteriales bacterium]|jgi:hypothetical protein